MLKVKKSRKIARHFWPQKVELEQPEEEKQNAFMRQPKWRKKKCQLITKLSSLYFILKLCFWAFYKNSVNIWFSNLVQFCYYLNFRAKNATIMIIKKRKNWHLNKLRINSKLSIFFVQIIFTEKTKKRWILAPKNYISKCSLRSRFQTSSNFFRIFLRVWKRCG